MYSKKRLDVGNTFIYKLNADRRNSLFCFGENPEFLMEDALDNNQIFAHEIKVAD
jgi:hypothetical protein